MTKVNPKIEDHFFTAILAQRISKVALEMGNSPQVVKDHYFEIVDEHAAKDYWSIKRPATDDRKIVAIAS